MNKSANSKKQITKSILENKHNKDTVYYYLLLK